MKRGGFDYLKSYWNLAEVAIILASLAAIACYIYRYFLVRDILEKVSERERDNERER
jgi:Polycystin cation channel